MAQKDWLDELFAAHPGMSPHTENSARAAIRKHMAAERIAELKKAQTE